MTYTEAQVLCQTLTGSNSDDFDICQRFVSIAEEEVTEPSEDCSMSIEQCSFSKYENLIQRTEEEKCNNYDV